MKSFLAAYKMRVYISYIFYLLILLCCKPGACAPLSKQNSNSQDLNIIGEVANIIETEYVNKVDESQLAESAVLGMLQSLDGYATYLKPEEYSRVLMNTSGSFGGLGIEIIKEGSFLHITGVVDNAPASKAGVEIGDIITHINNKPVAKMTLIAALNAMRGKAGKRVQLKIFRARQKKIIPFNLTCAYIKIESVKLKIENDIAVIRIAFFNQKTSRELSEIIRQGIINAQTKIRGVIIDLRDNPGGLLTEGVKVAGLFLNKGSKILSIRDKNNTEIEAFHATEKKDIISGMPIAILVNSNSASAAEIFTGALRHHKRAIVIGETTMGKGAVQDIIPLQTVPGAAVKITTSLCYLPDDKKIDKVGISPDIFIESAEDDLSIANLMGWATTKGRAKEQTSGRTNSSLRFKDKAHPVTSKADHQHNEAMLVALDVLHNQEQYSILLSKNSNEKRKN